MHRLAYRLVCSAGLAGFLWAGLSSISYGQPLAPATATALPSQGSYRKLVPGVLQKVDPERELEETFDIHDVVELVAVDNSFDWAKNVIFRRDIWFLHFEFKPVRYIDVDIPQADGHMQRKLVRYLVYNVTNPGRVMHPEPDQDRTVRVMPVNRPVKFVPQFSLESQDDAHRVYPDHVMPLAMVAIRQREDPNRVFLNTIEMTRELPVGQTFWGIATWEDVDPKITHYSIFVNGLTNAYRFTDDPGVYKAGDPIGKGRHLVRKTLKLNFWKPGDPFLEHEEEVRYGIPGEVDYEWLYR